MTIEWRYCFRSRLANTVTADEVAERLMALSGPASDPLSDSDCPPPSFGDGFHHDGSRFAEARGIVVQNGEILLGLLDHDLQRPVVDADGQRKFGLVVLTEVLSWISDGPVGEIVGSIRSEFTEAGHAYPMIRCADGRIRIVDTPTVSAGQTAEGAIAVPDIIPSELLTPGNEAHLATIDLEGLAATLQPSTASL